MSQPAFPGRLSREDPDLTERQRYVFAALVTLHGRTARPVGSESLAQHAGIPLSPASIRSALAELEAMGLLERLHSSAGRVPSARGYEFFVRTLLRPAVLPPALVAEVTRTLRRSTQDVEHLLNEASRLLSSLTRQLGLAFAASLEGETLSRLDLVTLGQRRALMLLDLGGGSVHTLLLELDSPLERGELEEVAGVLRERLVGRPLSEVRECLATDPELVRRSAVRLVALAAAESWARPLSTPFFSAGVMRMAEQPEFANSERLGRILQAVETGSPLDRLMIAGFEGQVAVRVGLDEDRALSGCSLVSYVLPGAVRGAVGILGPLRMDYSRALAVVDAVGSHVAELLES
jgi:heat-inducible transcriptional repressor